MRTLLIIMAINTALLAAIYFKARIENKNLHKDVKELGSRLEVIEHDISGHILNTEYSFSKLNEKV